MVRRRAFTVPGRGACRRKRLGSALRWLLGHWDSSMDAPGRCAPRIEADLLYPPKIRHESTTAASSTIAISYYRLPLSFPSTLRVARTTAFAFPFGGIFGS